MRLDRFLPLALALAYLPSAFSATPEDYASESLVWIGGEQGVWSATEANWSDPQGNTVPWTDGSIALITNACALTLPGPVTCQGLRLFADLTLDGAEFSLLPDAQVRLVAASSLTCNAPLSLGRDTAFLDAPKAETCFPAEGCLIAPNRQLKELRDLACDCPVFWGKVTRTAHLTLDNGGQEGLYGIDYDPETDTATVLLKLVITGSYNTGLLAAKLLFEQRPEGVYLIVPWTKAALGSYDLNKNGATGETTVWDIDFERGAYRPATLVSSREELTANYQLLICNLELLFDGQRDTSLVLANASLTTPADGDLPGGFGVSNGTFRLNADYDAMPRLKVEPDATFEIGPDSTCRWTNLGTQDIRHTVRGPVELYGTLEVYQSPESNGYLPYNLFDPNQPFTVHPGGRITCTGKGYNHYGFCGCNLILLDGARLEVEGSGILGCNNNKLTLDGGRLTLDPTGARNFLHKLTLRGGTVDGLSAIAAYNYYKTPSTWVVDGDRPSEIQLETLVLGSQNLEIPAGSTTICRLDATVADATSDADSDLLVAARLCPAEGLRCAPEAAGNCGLRKLGAGTMELLAADNAVTGSVEIAEGSLRLADAASLHGELLSLAGGALDLGASAGSTFVRWSLSAPSTIRTGGGRIDLGEPDTWADGAKLLIEGPLSHNRIKAGASFASLTPEQIALVGWRDSASGKTYAVRLSGNGYLNPFLPGVILLMH